MKTDNDAVADFALYVREQTKAGEVIPHTKVETLLDAKRRTANYRRRLKTARKVLLRQDIELDGYGAAKSIGLRRLAAQELVEKTGQRIRATNRAAKRALTTCGVASAHVKGNGDIRLIAARAAIARTMGRQAKTALAARGDYETQFPRILDAFGAAPVAAFADARMTKDVRQWHEAIEGDRAADKALGALSVLLAFAVADGLLAVNIAAGVRKRYRGAADPASPFISRCADAAWSWRKTFIGMCTTT